MEVVEPGRSPRGGRVALWPPRSAGVSARRPGGKDPPVQRDRSRSAQAVASSQGLPAPDPALAIFGAEPAASRDRRATIDAYRQAATLGGRPASGRLIFQKTCATCHRVSGEGIEVGPDLATVAGRTADDLLLHILDPNREVAANFVNYNVATTDGRTVSGIIVSESATALILKRAEGATDVIPRAQVETIASTGLSLMPEGLEKGLTPQDLADLMAFLKSIKAPSAGSPVSGRGQ